VIWPYAVFFVVNDKNVIPGRLFLRISYHERKLQPSIWDDLNQPKRRSQPLRKSLAARRLP
jgi:hypothetical protein